MAQKMICPGCGGEVIGEDDVAWIYMARFYCSEECAKKQMGFRK